MTPESDSEIVVDDPTAPARDSPAVTTTRTAEVVVYVLLLALALLLAFDNWRSGMGWAKDGPQTGYLPFYLCVILASASLFGLGVAFRRRAEAVKTFVTRDQLRRVMQVFVPTFLFVLLVQWLGLYVASLLLVAGFMRFIGRIAVVEIAAHERPVRDHHVCHVRDRVRRDHAQGPDRSALRPVVATRTKRDGSPDSSRSRFRRPADVEDPVADGDRPSARRLRWRAAWIGRAERRGDSVAAHVHHGPYRLRL
jgi:hypothetical protein